jgi:hypothetical protein
LGDRPLIPQQKKGVATATQILLVVQIALMAIQVLALVHRINLLHVIERGGDVSQTQGDAADNGVNGTAGLVGIAFIATVVTWCMWQHAAQRTAIAMSSQPLNFSPGWAVGWWFIPFANLVQPFRTVKELWKASHGGAWENMKTWGVIPVWWAFWLASFVHVWFGESSANFGFGIGTVGRAPQTAAEIANRDSWEIVSLLIRVVAAVLAVLIVRAIVSLQERAVAAWAPPVPPSPAEIPPPPPPRPMPPI